MKAISLKQPFASLVHYGEKSLETRRWKTNHRGPLLICASLNIHKGKTLVGGVEWDCEWLVRNTGGNTYPTGVALCVVDVLNCRRMTVADEAAACCRIYPDAWAWEIGNVRTVRPLVVKGALNLFDVPDNLIEEVSSRYVLDAAGIKTSIAV